MPIYDFECPNCGVFDKLLKINERNSTQYCVKCGSSSDRVILNASKLLEMPVARRLAMETNERASHEPRIRSHGVGCSCCSSNNKSQSARTFTNKRPWMISH